MRRYPPWTLALALGLATLSHGLYSTYDLIGRHQTGHRVPAREVIGVGLVSYAFNLNLGSLIGGVAFRYRLYSRLGLDAPTITRVLGLSLLTNWLGYLFVAGVVFLVWKRKRISNSRLTNSLELYTEEKKKTSFDA